MKRASRKGFEISITLWSKKFWLATIGIWVFPKIVVPQNTPKWLFLVGKPMVVGYHHFKKTPYHCCRLPTAQLPLRQNGFSSCDASNGVSVTSGSFHPGLATGPSFAEGKGWILHQFLLVIWERTWRGKIRMMILRKHFDWSDSCKARWKGRFVRPAPGQNPCKGHPSPESYCYHKKQQGRGRMQ